MTESRGIERPLALIAALLTGLMLAAPVSAACREDAGGIGGTGHAPSGKATGKSGGKDRGGIGGTGRSEGDAGGIGGTGLHEDESGGVGGTGVRGDAGGVGGTGVRGDAGGVGGTGVRGDAGGVGGTGVRGDAGGVGGTGIVGVITGFGSVCVNGLEVEYDASTPVDADGTPARATSLAVGQVVVIDAADRDGVLHADRIAVRNVAVGPVAHIDAKRGQLEVLGQRVQLDPATRLADAGGKLLAPSDIKAGSFVAVSGLRRGDGSVVATRVETVAPRELVSVTGPLSSVAPHRAAMAGLAIEAPASSALRDLASRAALVIGRLDPASGALQAQRIAPAVDFSKGHERVSIEGLVQGPTADGFRTEHADVDTSGLAAGARGAATGARVVVTGAPEPGGRIRAERVEVLAPDRSSIGDPARTTGERAGAAREEREDPEDETDPGEQTEHSDEVEHGDEVEHEEHGEHAETPEQVEHQETPETVERPDEPEHPEGAEHADTPDVPEVGEPPETPEHVEKPEAPEAPEPVERPETPEAPEPVERPETPEAPEKVERPETPEPPEVERPERPEVPEVERPETPERPEVERPETPERPEVERPETPERPEAPERPEIERPEHDD